MSLRWEDLDARVRGLGTHLIPPATLSRLAEAESPAALSRALESAGIPLPSGTSAGPAELELAVRRWAARSLRTLYRWLGPRSAPLGILLEDEDRRSLRAILRGAAAGVAGSARLAGLIPTPVLPERMLNVLAEFATARQVAATLAAWQHPYGPVLLAAAGAAEPDLLRLESALNRCWAERAAAGARAGGRWLRGWVADRLDEENLLGVLLLVEQSSDLPPEAAFLPGGRRIGLDRYTAALAGGSAAAAARQLADRLGDDRAALVIRHAERPDRLETALARRCLEQLSRVMRLDPLGPAPVLEYLLRLREQVGTLRRLIWSAGMGMPPEHRRGLLAAA